MPHGLSLSPTSSERISWPLLKASLWMRAGIGGAGSAIVGPALVANGEASLMAGAVALIGGAALAAFAWRRTMRLLGEDPPAASVVRRRSASPISGAPAVQAR